MTAKESVLQVCCHIIIILLILLFVLVSKKLMITFLLYLSELVSYKIVG